MSAPIPEPAHVAGSLEHRASDPYAIAFALAVAAVIGPILGVVALVTHTWRVLGEPVMPVLEMAMPDGLIQLMPLLVPTALVAAIAWGLQLRRPTPRTRVPRGTGALWFLAGLEWPIALLAFWGPRW